MKATTLEEALSMVPTHWPLICGLDKWQCKDRYETDSAIWTIESANKDIGKPVNESTACRPIPQDVRESIVEMILHAARDTAKDSAWAEDVLGRWILAGKP